MNRGRDNYGVWLQSFSVTDKLHYSLKWKITNDVETAIKMRTYDIFRWRITDLIEAEIASGK